MVKAEFWKGKKVFITGHTGFKGAWLAHSLLQMGAKVIGYSLPAPTQPNLFDQLDISSRITHIEADITDRPRMIAELKKAAPDVVFHMAAQSLVRYSYKNPLETFDTNVTGTLNILEAARHTAGIKALVIITTDKCYLNNDSGKLFTEEDSLGGKDPYSASKAAAEIVTTAYYQSFLKEAGTPTASVRAGNVIGGGDWAEDRLIPDVIRASLKNEAVNIRSPKATRPWQFVLEPLAGYMTIAENLVEQGHKFAGGWNFGPEQSDIQPVDYVLQKLKETVPFELKLDTSPQPVEAKLLALSIDKAKKELGWQPKLNLDQAIEWTGKWYKSFADGKDIKETTTAQVKEYFNI